MYLLEKDDSYLYWYSNEGVENLLKKDYTIVEEIKYAIKKIYNVLIIRDVEWYEYTKKFQDQFWDDVERAKNGEYLIPEIKRKRNDGCLISDEK